MSGVVDTLTNAKVGDTVWHFDAQMNRYENGKFMGRGVWKEVVIESETRASFIINRQKYDRKTGHERGPSGYTSYSYIYGAMDRENKRWRDASWSIADAVKGCRDTEVLKQIAALVGWVSP